MSYSNFPRGFPQGITVRGIPLQQAYAGQVFWVHNSSSYVPDGGIAGNNGNPGTYQKPFADVKTAIAACTASRGDIVMIMPGYTETLPGAAAASGDGWYLEKAGIAIVGLGAGDLRPKISFDAAADEIEVRADNISISNIWFDNNVASLTQMMNVAATGKEFTLSNCLIDGGAAGQDIHIAVALNTCQGAHVENNFFNSLVNHGGTAITSTSTECIKLNAADRSVIKGNTIMGDYTTSAINGVTAASLGIVISDNTIHNIATENIAGAIDLVDGCTGVVAYNRCYVGNTTAGPAGFMDLASCSNIENYGDDTLGESTYAIPIGTAAAS